MEQDKAINRVLRDIKQFDLIAKDILGEVKSGEIRYFLNVLYVAGWEEGYRTINQHGNKTIGQYNKSGKLIKTYKSLKEAARLSGFSVKGIYNSITRNKLMRQGWTWKYLILTDLQPPT